MQRFLYNYYIWEVVWSGLNAPQKPSADQFLCTAQKLSEQLHQGQALERSLFVVFVAIDDFWWKSPKKRFLQDEQRAYFRALLRAARQDAERWSLLLAQQRQEATKPAAGRRKALSTTPSPSFASINPNARLLGNGPPYAFSDEDFSAGHPYTVLFQEGQCAQIVLVEQEHS